jgi:uroporphyrinogen III methyltransferase/synthase
VALYETVPEDARPEAVEAALGADYLTFTSSSTVRNLLALLDGDGRRRASGMRVVSIGPVTSETARAAGLTVHAEAKEFTVDGLVAALLEDVKNRPAAV